MKSVNGRFPLSAGSLLRLSIAGGSLDMSPDIERLLCGLTFQVGLDIVYFVGADSFTNRTRSLAEELFKSGVIGMVTSDIAGSP